MKLILTLLSIPYFIICMILHKNKNINIDLNKCLEYINREQKSFSLIDDYYYDVLVTAEDHRNSMHYGIDPIAIFRCIYMKLTKKTIQGGSTVEQQLVRTLTGRYERTMRRKIREQVIAILLKKKIKNRVKLGKAYLHCAYFGYNKVGFFNLSAKERKDASELVARLKYPTKKNQTPCNNEKTMKRKIYIDEMLKRNSCMQMKGRSN
ncbi:hypothetical protein GJV07_02055 [Enterobacteriaceae bacterium RIT711]|nr:hypothetical protein [Enterobacteriaceae bacterium RIT711]